MSTTGGERAGTSAQSGSRPITEHAREIRRDASALAEDLRGTRKDLEAALGEELTERPLRAVGIALGVGYLLGGGLTSRLTYTAIATATRLTTAMMLARELYELGQRWQRDEGGEEGYSTRRTDRSSEQPSQYSGIGSGSSMGAGSYQGATAQEPSSGAGRDKGDYDEDIGGRKPPTETHH